MSPEQRAPAAPPSWADRLALAAVVAAACVGEVGCLRDLHPGSSIRAFGANVRLYGVLLFLVYYLSVLAPFIGAIVGSSVLRAGGYIRAGFVGLTAYLGLAAGLSFAGPDRNEPELTDYLPHLLGSFFGAVVGTTWLQRYDKRRHARLALALGLLLLVVLLLPILVGLVIDAIR